MKLGVTAVDTTVGQTEARPLEIAKYMSAGETRLAKSVVEARPPGIEKRSATTADATTVDSTVAKSVGNVRHPRIAEHSATTKPVLEEPPGELGDGEARHPGIAKYVATTKSVLVEPPGEFHDENGRSWSRTNGTSSAAASTSVKLADETLPPEITEYGAVQDAGWVKRWFNDWSFGFITPKEGGEDVYIHLKQLVCTKVLKQEDTVSCDTEYDERKGKYKAVNCIVSPSGGGQACLGE